MVTYVSTRGGETGTPFMDTVLKGMAKDGGLFVPETLPVIPTEDMRKFRLLPYHEVAFCILHQLAPDIPMHVLWDITSSVYNSKVFCNAVDGDVANDIVPVRKLNNDMYLVRLSNGPTLAFKDIALQLLGYFFEIALNGRNLNIVGATSGDTGSAAIHAMLGRKGIQVFMLSPRNGMSEFQQSQIWGVDNPCIHNYAVLGSFDEGQRVVKGVFSDKEFKEKYCLGAVNSINWARIAAQVVYYFWAYSRIFPNADENMDVAVPTGNFGNIEAGYIAKLMGLPIQRFILATNENDVLYEFFQTGIYKPRKNTITTLSPSMDITEASNLERYMYHLFDGDTDLLHHLYRDYSVLGYIDLSSKMKRVAKTGFVAERVTEPWALSIIKHMYCESRIIIDPHTAVAMAAAKKHATAGVPIAVLETAQPCKFDGTIQMVLGRTAPRPESMKGMENITRHFTEIEPDVQIMKAYIEANA